MSLSLSTLVRDYLAHRRKLGFSLDREHLLLPQFARFHQRAARGQPLQISLIIKWAVLPATGNRNYYVKRLAMVRSFARYCATFDPRTQVPDRRILGRGYQRTIPHLYSDEEIRTLLLRARSLPTYRSPLRPLIFETLIGLVACTGIRINEALRLRIGDFDADAGTLLVPGSKFSPARLLPLHPSTVQALRRYLRARLQRQPEGEHFFMNRLGGPLKRSSTHETFGHLRAGIVSNGVRAYPRIHDLRHSFATRHIAKWSRQAAPVAHRLLLLSRYLGHKNFADTWWYVSADPATLRTTAARFDNFYRKG
jgi:integrase